MSSAVRHCASVECCTRFDDASELRTLLGSSMTRTSRHLTMQHVFMRSPSAARVQIAGQQRRIRIHRAKAPTKPKLTCPTLTSVLGFLAPSRHHASRPKPLRELYIHDLDHAKPRTHEHWSG